MMPWTKDDYPDSMKNLDPKVREKAIEIANSLVDDDYEEGRALAIATEQAKRWASRREDGDDRDEEVWRVVPRGDSWAVRRDGAEKASSVHDTKDEAVERGQELADKHDGVLVKHRADGTPERQADPELREPS